MEISNSQNYFLLYKPNVQIFYFQSQICFIYSDKNKKVQGNLLIQDVKKLRTVHFRKIYAHKITIFQIFEFKL